jgi:hypothetical protein
MFPEDYKRPDGTVVPGKYAVFSMMTTPAIAKEVHRLSATYPELKDMYRNFVNTTFASELWPKEIAYLNLLQSIPGLQLGWDGSQFYVNRAPIDYSKLSRFEQRERPDITAPYLILSKLNMGLGSVATMAKEMNMDMESYMIGLLKSSGVEFKNVKSPDATIPEKMGAAIMSFRAPPEGTSGTPNTNKRTSEAPTGSQTPSIAWDIPHFAEPERTRMAANVPDWLKNPTGTVKRPTSQNLSDQTILGEDITQIPPGVSPADFIKSLKK